MRYAHKTRRVAGFSMTELLVVLVAVGILSSLAVPVYVSKAEKAKVTAAQQDLRELAEAEEACATAHGFYVPLQVLDDLPSIQNDPNDVIDIAADTIDQEYKGQIKLVDPSRLSVNLATDQETLFDPLNPPDPTDKRVENLLNNWAGPFINFQRFYYGDADSPTDEDLDEYERRRDYPLDPWGNPYRFYSPAGIIGRFANSDDRNQWDQDTFSDGEIMTGTSYDRFDRFAIVSYGPDGISDDDPARSGLSPEPEPDDIIYYFGPVLNGR